MATVNMVGNKAEKLTDTLLGTLSGIVMIKALRCRNQL